MTVKLKKIPDFKNREDEADFWDTHDFTDYGPLVDARVVFDLDKPKDETLIIRLQSKIKNTLEKAARSQGISPSTLSRMWIIEKLQEKCYN